MKTKMSKIPLPYLISTLLLTLLLFTNFTQANSHISTTNLVTTTCNQTPDPDLCVSALQADPRSSKATNTQTLTSIMIDVVKTHFTSAISYVQDLTRKTHDPDMIRALQECVQLYRVVVDTSIDLAMRAVQEGDPKYGESAMVDAGNEAEACRMGFPGGKDPHQMMDRTRILHGVSNVAASMIKTME